MEVNYFTGTIISTCPDRFHKGDDSDNKTLYKILSRSFQNALERLEHTSPKDLVSLIVRNCVTFFADQSNSGLDNPASWTFAAYIATQVRSC
jgi:hypothetical protein